MDIQYFDALSDLEVQQLAQAPAQIAVLIAGADDNIDKSETGWATKLVNYRTFTSDPRLHEYYELVSAAFEPVLNSLVESWQPESTEKELSAALDGLNTVLGKLDADYADLLKDSWRSLAKEVAQASGGIFGMGSVGREEAKLIDLPMIK